MLTGAILAMAVQLTGVEIVQLGQVGPVDVYRLWDRTHGVVCYVVPGLAMSCVKD